MCTADSGMNGGSNAHQDRPAHNHPSYCTIGFFPVAGGCGRVQRIERVLNVADWFGNPHFDVTTEFERKLKPVRQPPRVGSLHSLTPNLET
jgi:hypothetical protein